MRWPIAVLGAGILYLLFWPVPIEPVVWVPDPDPGLTGPHAQNEKLAPLALLTPMMGQGTGRLLSHDPASGETRVWLDGLRFANGVALGPDDAFVLVNETLAARIWRLWLKGPRAGESEIYIDRLPGYPDNLSFNGRDTFWVAMPATRQPALERLAGRPFIRKILLRLPETLRRIEPEPLAWVIGLDPDGGVRHSLQTASGAYRTVTSVNEFDGQLYLGSIDMDTVARIPAP